MTLPKKIFSGILSFMDTEHYHTLIAATRLYLLQEYAQEAYIPAEKENYDYFKKNYTKPQTLQPKATLPPPPAQAPPMPMPKVAKVPTPPKAPPPPPQPEAAKPVAHPQAYLLQALARPMVHGGQAPFGALLERLKEEKVYVDAPEYLNASLQWKQEYPDCLVVSFQAAPDPFIEKMCQALCERLQVKAELRGATLETAASLITYAATGVLKAAILVWDQKINDWLYPISEIETESKEVGPLTCIGRLYGVPLYTLKIAQVPSQEEKGALWKALQHLL